MRQVNPIANRKKQVLSGLLLILLWGIASCPIRHVIKSCFAQDLKAAQHPKQSTGGHHFVVTGFASCSFEKESSEHAAFSVHCNQRKDRDPFSSSSNKTFLSSCRLEGQIIGSGSPSQDLQAFRVPLFLIYRQLLI
jgi:hypothetical protein